jgi:hypothetical protein
LSQDSAPQHCGVLVQAIPLGKQHSPELQMPSQHWVCRREQLWPGLLQLAKRQVHDPGAVQPHCCEQHWDWLGPSAQALPSPMQQRASGLPSHSSSPPHWQSSLHGLSRPRRQRKPFGPHWGLLIINEQLTAAPGFEQQTWSASLPGQLPLSGVQRHFLPLHFFEQHCLLFLHFLPFLRQAAATSINPTRASAATPPAANIRSTARRDPARARDFVHQSKRMGFMGLLLGETVGKT